MVTKRKSSFGFLVLACANTLLCLAPPVGAQQRQTLGTAVAAPAHAHVVGRLPGSQQLNLALTLILRNEAQLEA